jgi:hypothetical protein
VVEPSYINKTTYKTSFGIVECMFVFIHQSQCIGCSLQPAGSQSTSKLLNGFGFRRGLEDSSFSFKLHNKNKDNYFK